MKKWLAIPALAGAVVLGGVAVVANADKSIEKSAGTLDMEEENVENIGGLKVATEKNEPANDLGILKTDHQKVSADKYLSATEAIAIAMERAEGVVTELELDHDDGRVHYEIEIEDGMYEYEIEIDAITGEILDFEEELDD